ncbi:hypothetical protein AAVH_39661, partial [Aphelenchoides avenae]
ERLWVLVGCLTLPALVRAGYSLYSDHCTRSSDVNGCIRRLIVAYNAVRRLQHREDFLLLSKYHPIKSSLTLPSLVYSILQFIFMLVMTICNVAMALQFLLMQDPRWLSIPTVIISYNFDVVCFSGPFCLLTT